MARLPRYRGAKWIRSGLPERVEPWEAGGRRSLGRHHAAAEALRKYLRHATLKWPKAPIFFLADPHADAEAFVASLVASGGVRKTGPGLHDFRLTAAGRRATFVIGGDCLDKGPSNLEMLRTLRVLMDLGPKLKILAGNHDVRLMLGLQVLGRERETRSEHFFVRMGPKVVPLLKEIHDAYPPGPHALKGIPGRKECRRRMYPSNNWFQQFPKIASGLLSAPAIEREVTRMRKKFDRFETACTEAGLNMRMVYAAALKCQELFLRPGGEFSWFFDRMQLACRKGSFLFIHAGFDDQVATLIEDQGVAVLNRLYRDQVCNDQFAFYYGPVANAMRTKYREADLPLTRDGVERMHRSGIHAVVHGHRNRTTGQRIVLRQGMLHCESDITMDRNSRAREGLDGYGAGVTIVCPEGWILGISTDHPRAKLLDPGDLLRRRSDGSRPGK